MYENVYKKFSRVVLKTLDHSTQSNLETVGPESRRRRQNKPRPLFIHLFTQRIFHSRWKVHRDVLLGLVLDHKR